MTRLIRTCAILVVAATLVGCSALEQATAPVSADYLVGIWQVDLRPTPDAEPYYQDFIVADVSGNSFTGSFYGTEITEARINADWGTLRIAFITADGSGPYYHSATLQDGRLDGLSNSSGRDFLSYWSAVKQ